MSKELTYQDRLNALKAVPENLREAIKREYLDGGRRIPDTILAIAECLCKKELTINPPESEPAITAEAKPPKKGKGKKAAKKKGKK